MKVAPAVAVLVAGLALTACSSPDPETVVAPSPAASATSLSSPSSSATFGEGDGVALGGTALPDNWPDQVPAYANGTVLSAAVLDGGAIINASWATDDAVETAWATVDTALRDRGFVPLGELGEESQFIQDETQTTDTYRNDEYEVNVVVVAGEQTTVLLNASRLT